MVSPAHASLRKLLGNFDAEIRGCDPVFASPFRVGEAAAAALAACASGAAAFFELRGGPAQRVRVDVEAAAASLVSFAFQRVEGRTKLPTRAAKATTALYPARDGRWIHLHGGFPKLRQGTLELLDCDDTRDSVAAAVRNWDAQHLEDALAERGLCGAMVRSAQEWLENPQGRALASQPPLEVIRIGDAPREIPAAGAERPLQGIRVLDLTRVLAGPTCARTLAEHGAEVLRIAAPHLPFVPPFVIDTGHGKRSAHLDLRDNAAVETLRELVCGADVFSQGYRGSTLARRGFGPSALAQLRPGIIYVSINCYGHAGPWVERPGWEQLAQSATGVAMEQGDTAAPQLIGAAACDYSTGYLAAAGVMRALALRATEGGSYHVRVSLAQTAMWFQQHGRVEPGAAGGPDAARLEPFMTSSDTPHGRVRHLGPVAQLSETPARWDQPTVPLGAHPAAWTDA